jgi:hypothetical protein
MKDDVIYIISNAINNLSKIEELSKTIEILSSKNNFSVSFGEYFTSDLCLPILWKNINCVISKLKEKEVHLNKPHILTYIKQIKDKVAKIDNNIIFEMAFDLKNYEIAKEYYNTEEHKKYSNELANMAFGKEDYRFAVSIWEKNPNRPEKEYNIAKNYITEYPEKIEYLFKLNEYANVIDEFHKHETEELSDKYVSFIIQSLFVKKKNEEAINLFKKINDEKNFVSLFEYASKLTKNEYMTIITEHLNICQKIAEISKDSDQYINSIVKEHKNIESIYIALALSQFEKYSKNIEKQISEFLNNECVRNFEKIPHRDNYLFDIGKAVEMGGKFTYTLDFYEKAEKFFNDNDNEEYSKLAASKWISAKKEQIKDDEEKERKLTNPREIEEYKRKIKNRENEVEEKKKRYKLEDDILSYSSSLDWAKIFKFILEYEQEKYDIEFERKKPDELQKSDDEKIATKNPITDFYGYKFEYGIERENLTITLPDKGKIVIDKNNVVYSNVDFIKF